MKELTVALLLWEGLWWVRRRGRRRRVYAQALARARELGRPLVVVGAPDRGPTAGYPCGDITIDLGPSGCPTSVQADITERIPLPDDSCVVFVSCVLEYVDDLDAAWRELQRVGGRHVFLVDVEPWTFTGWLYPGTRHVAVAHQLEAAR